MLRFSRPLLTIACVIAVGTGCNDRVAEQSGRDGRDAGGSEGEGEGEGGAEGEGEGEGEPLPPPPYAVSTKAEVAWKRHRALEADLLAALALGKQELCNELGLYACVDFVHQVPLGGNDPFVKSQYEPLARPTVTTPVALERVVLSGCVARARKDAAGPAVVFTALDLSAASVSAAEADATAQALARRLLARELTGNELALVRELMEDDQGSAVSAHDFAVTACLTIGTMVETIFY